MSCNESDSEKTRRIRLLLDIIIPYEMFFMNLVNIFIDSKIDVRYISVICGYFNSFEQKNLCSRSTPHNSSLPKMSETNERLVVGFRVSRTACSSSRLNRSYHPRELGETQPHAIFYAYRRDKAIRPCTAHKATRALHSVW